MAADPSNTLAWQHMGALSTLLGRPADGESALRQALALRPDYAPTRHALALTLMTLGRYPEAWSYYAARHEIPELRLPTPGSFPFPQWRDEDPRGKHVVIFPEQGFGDQIQFARFVPMLQAAGAKVTLLARPPLVRLFAHSFPAVTVLSASGAVEFPDPDLWTMSGALVGHLGATLEALPSAPYLSTPATWPPLPLGFKVGLVTKGSPTHRNDANRSLPPAAAARLRESFPGVTVSLDPPDTGATDFADTAAIIAQLDLVVAVDTAVVHLAGALGRPCFVLLPALETDWRWLRDRTDSPWYPSLRLFRRSLDETDWNPAIDRLTRDVQALAVAS